MEVVVDYKIFNVRAGGYQGDACLFTGFRGLNA